MSANAPIVFEYFEYRDFIADYIDHKKGKNAKYSYRFFSSKAGFSSTNFLSLVVKGKRNLTTYSIGKIAKGLRLNKQERSFFEDLVLMNQSKSHDERDYYYQRMLNSKPFSRIRKLSKSSYEYFSNWYYPVVREIIEIVPSPIDTDLIASLIIPRIKASQVEKAIMVLERLKLIGKDDSGYLKKTDATLTTGDEIQSLQVANFHKAMLKLAAKAVTDFSSSDRDISGIVLSVNEKKIAEIKQRIAAFRRELIELAGQESDENQVLYIQINAFPLMHPYEEISNVAITT